MDQATFDQAYWLAQPPQVRALQNMPAQADREKLAAALASQGFKVDVPIMVWGWDPFQVMSLRASFGFTWVPSALGQPVTIAPGLSAPGAVPYDPAHPPIGSIKVSLDLADYPPFDPPAPPPTPLTDFVGPQSFGNIYISLVGDTNADGAPVSDSRGNFVLHRINLPFGQERYYERLSG